MSSFINFITKYKNIIIVILVFCAIGVLLFREFYWWGTVNIYTSHTPISVSIEGKKKYECLQSPCHISLPPRTYKYQIDSDGYNTLWGEIEIQLQQQTDITISPTRSMVSLGGIDTITSSTFTPKTIRLPIENGGIDASIFQAYYENQTLFHKDGHTLYTHNTPFWASTDEVGRGIWILTPEIISFFNIKTGQNIPALSLDTNQINIDEFSSISDTQFLYKAGDRFYLYSPQNRSQELIITTPSLNTLCKIPTSETLYYLDSSGSDIGLHSYDIKSSDTEILTYIENKTISSLYGIRCQEKSIIVYPKVEQSFVLNL